MQRNLGIFALWAVLALPSQWSMVGCASNTVRGSTSMGKAERSDKKRALTPLIERAYSLDEVPVAYRRMLSGEAQGYLVITP